MSQRNVYREYQRPDSKYGPDMVSCGRRYFSRPLNSRLIGIYQEDRSNGGGLINDKWTHPEYRVVWEVSCLVHDIFAKKLNGNEPKRSSVRRLAGLVTYVKRLLVNTALAVAVT